MKQIGCKLEVDLGTGTLEIIPLSAMGETITFSESIAGFGGSELSFTLRDLDSPVKSALLRGMRRARLTLYWGTPGATLNDVIFDGYLREARWQHDTRSADVTCQDASIKFANQRVFYTLATFAGKTRETIIGEIAVAMGIPTGTIAAPGTNYKAINEGGDNTVLQFFSDLVAPAGARVWWRDGALQIGPAGLGTPVAVLKLADIRGPINVTPPATTTPNSIEFTSTLFPSLGAQGYTTTVDTVTTPGPYTPAGSVRVQDHITGAISAHVVTPGEETNVSQIVTTTSKWGNTVVSVVVEEYGWYAPKACPREIYGSGSTVVSMPFGGTETYERTGYTETFNTLFDVYEFGISGSGDWRTQERETWMLIKETVTINDFSATEPYWLRTTTSTVSEYCAQEIPLGVVLLVTDELFPPTYAYPTDGGDPIILYAALSFTGDAMTGIGLAPVGFGAAWPWRLSTLADGTAWTFGYELFRSTERQTTTYALADDGHLKSAATRVESVMPFVWRLSGAAFAPVADNLIPPAQNYVLGPFASPRFCDAYGGTLLKDYTWVVEYALDEFSYDLAHWETTTLTPVTRALANQPDTMAQFSPPSAGTVSVATPLPYPVTRTIITSDPQPQRIFADEDVLIALNGIIPGTGSSDFPETVAEMAVCGLAILVNTCSPVVDFGRDPDGTIRAGDTITVDPVVISDEAEDMLVLSNTITLNFKTNEFSQALTCLWIPPELA